MDIQFVPFYTSVDENMGFFSSWFLKKETPENMHTDIYIYAANDDEGLNHISLGIVLSASEPYPNLYGELLIQFESVLENGSRLCQIMVESSSLELGKIKSKYLTNTMGFKWAENEEITPKSVIQKLKTLQRRRFTENTSSALLYASRFLPDELPKADCYNVLLLKYIMESCPDKLFKEYKDIAVGQHKVKKELIEEEGIQIANVNSKKIKEAFEKYFLFGGDFSCNIDITRCDRAPVHLQVRQFFPNFMERVLHNIERLQARNITEALVMPYNKITGEGYHVKEKTNKQKAIEELNNDNIHFWIIDGQHSIDACLSILKNNKYAEELRQRVRRRKCRFLSPDTPDEVAVAIADDINESNKLNHDASYIEKLRHCRDVWKAEGARILKEGSRKADRDKKIEEKMVTMLKCGSMNNLKDKKMWFTMDDNIWESFNEIFNMYVRGAIGFPPERGPKQDINNYMEARYKDLTHTMFRPLSGLTNNELESLIVKIKANKIYFKRHSKQIYPAGVSSLIDECKAVKSTRYLKEALVEFAYDNDEVLEVGCITAENILSHYGIPEANFQRWLNLLPKSGKVKLVEDIKLEFSAYLVDQDKERNDAMFKKRNYNVIQLDPTSIHVNLSRWDNYNKDDPCLIPLVVFDDFNLQRELKPSVYRDIFNWFGSKAKKGITFLFFISPEKYGTLVNEFRSSYDNSFKKNFYEEIDCGVYNYRGMIHMMAIFRFSKTKEKRNIPSKLKFYLPHVLRAESEKNSIVDNDSTELIELEANKDDFDIKESSDVADLVIRDCTDLVVRDSTDKVDRDFADLVDRDSNFLNLVFNLFAPKTEISSDGAKVFSCEKVFGFFLGPNFAKICMEKGIRSVSFVETDAAYKSIMSSYKQWDKEFALLQQDDTQLLLTNTIIASPPLPGNQLLPTNDSVASTSAAQLLLVNDSIASSPTPETQLLLTNSSSNINQRKPVKRPNEDCTSSKTKMSKKMRKCNPTNAGETSTPKLNDGENLIIGEESNLESLQIVDKQNYIGEEDAMIDEEDDKLIDEDGNEHNMEHEKGNSDFIVAKGEEQNMEKECNEDRFDEAKQADGIVIRNNKGEGDGMVIRNNKGEGEEVIGQGCEEEFSSDSERKYREDYYVNSSDSEKICK